MMWHTSTDGRELTSISGDIPSVLKIKDGIEVIGADLCRGRRIDKVIIPSSVIRIKKSAFEGCGLSEVVFEESDDLDASMAIDQMAFASNNLTEVTFADKIWYIGIAAFTDNPNLKVLKNGYGIRIIYRYAFADTGISQLDFNEFAPLLTTLKNKAFSTTNLKTISFAEPLAALDIESGAFSGNKVEEVLVPSGFFMGENEIKALEGLSEAKVIVE